MAQIKTKWTDARRALALVLVGAAGLSGCEAYHILEGTYIPVQQTVVVDGRSYSASVVRAHAGPGGTAVEAESTITIRPGLTVSCRGEADGPVCAQAVRQALAGAATRPDDLPTDGGNDGAAGGHAD